MSTNITQRNQSNTGLNLFVDNTSLRKLQALFIKAASTPGHLVDWEIRDFFVGLKHDISLIAFGGRNQTPEWCIVVEKRTRIPIYGPVDWGDVVGHGKVAKMEYLYEMSQFTVVKQ